MLPLGAADAASVAAIVRLAVDDLARAHAAWAALRHGAYYVTTMPELAPPVIPTEQVHPIPADDA